MTATPTYSKLHPEFRLLVFLVSIGFFMQALDSTIVNTAIPSMALQLNENPLRMHSIVIAYVLTVAACIPLSGWLADRFGVRNIYFSAIVIFTCASLGCGLSQNINQLLFFRIIQGVGGALLLPVGRLALLKLIPRSQFLAAMSLMSLAGLVGPLLGPTLGGWLVEFATWHWIFLINIPIGLLGLLVTFKAMPNRMESTVRTFDLKGFLLLVIAMIGLCLGLEYLAGHTYSRWTGILILGIGAIAALVYTVHAKTHPNALFRRKLFANRIYSIGILGNFFARLGSNAIPFILPLMLQVVFGFEPLYTGLLMIPLVVGSLFSKPIVRPIIQKFGYRPTLMINTVLLGLCIASFALLRNSTPVWLNSIHFFIFGLLNSLQFVMMNTLTLKDLSKEDASSGNSFLSMIMMLSMSIGVALAATLVDFFSQYFEKNQLIYAFHLSFICLGTINIITMIIFSKIPRDVSHQ